MSKEHFKDLLKYGKSCEGTCGGRNNKEPAHTCPFAEDIHGDSESLCTCCTECANNCAMDI